MGKTYAVILISFLGLLSLTVGVVILVRKQYLCYGKKGQFIGKVTGKKARSDGIGYTIMGLIFLGLSAAIYLWGGEEFTWVGLPQQRRPTQRVPA